MNKEEFLKAIMELPKAETINPISTMDSININDLMSAVDRLNKIPDYNGLLKENKQLKDNWNKLKDYIVGEYYMYLPLGASTKSITILIDKMQELERNDNNE